MLVISIQTENDVHDQLVIVLNRQSLERMQCADPAKIKMAEITKKDGRTLLQPTISVCYEEDEAALTKLVQASDIKAVLKYLHRGWDFRPDLGDHDRGPEKLSEGN
jgi:hypothetical protein